MKKLVFALVAALAVSSVSAQPLLDEQFYRDATDTLESRCSENYAGYYWDVCVLFGTSSLQRQFDDYTETVYAVSRGCQFGFCNPFVYWWWLWFVQDDIEDYLSDYRANFWR